MFVEISMIYLIETAQSKSNWLDSNVDTSILANISRKDYTCILAFMKNEDIIDGTLLFDQ